MKNFPKHLGCLLGLIACAFNANALTYYVSDCQSGAVAGCVAGNDSNPGTSAAAPWQTTAKVRSMFASRAAGDKFLFAKGGAWTNSAMLSLRNMNATATSPITFDSYKPSWYAGTNKPLLREPRADTPLIEFSGNPVVANGGYVVRNLSLLGAPASGFSTAIAIYNGAGNVLIDNVTTNEFRIALHCGDLMNNVTLRNSQITHSRFTGVLAGCSNLLIENNVFDHNGFDPNQRPGDENRNHAIYFSSPSSAAETSRGVTIRGNVFTNNVQFAGVCQGAPIVAHSFLDGVLIENNLIDETGNNGPNKGGCWGIAISPGYALTPEDIRNVTIRGNRVVNVGGVGIELGGCNNCVIENNVVIKNDGQDQVGIQTPGRASHPEDAPMGRLVIRNNSIYFGQTASWAMGIQIFEGSNHVLVNNLIYFAAGHANHYCFNGDGSFPTLPRSSFTRFNNNLCYHAGGDGHYSWNLATLQNAKAAKFDLNGLDSNPLITPAPTAANAYAMPLGNGSPAINAGNANYAIKDITGMSRGTQSDIGAFEKAAAGIPVCTLTAQPATIPAGGSSVIKATCTPSATSFTWTATGFPKHVATGSVMPYVNTVYKVVGHNAAGNSVIKSVTVKVTP